MARILIVDDEPNVRATLGRALGLEGYETGEAPDGAAALAALDGGGFDLALVDLAMPRLDGMGLLAKLRERGDTTPVIVLTAHGSVERAVAALQAGASDFLEKPPGRERLLHAVGQALSHARLRREVRSLRDATGEEAEMIGTGPLMDRLRDDISLAAPSDGRVLVTGENGTGKELVARAIHRQSPRRDRPFVKLNCAAVPQTLFESELFGHVRGAFTDARENRPGRFEQAHGGTLFLDEVGEVPLVMQPKLLRALESGEIQRLGAAREFRVDVRVVAATNRDLEAAVKEGAFRQDLYYRLNVVRLHVPPLRERAQDIPALAERFLTECCRRNGLAPRRLHDEALALLQGRAWPGNVRELRNAMERLAILVPGELIRAADVSRLLPAEAAGEGGGEGAGPLRDRVAAFERRVIAAALEEHAGSMAAAARALGLERSHLYKKMRALGLREAGPD